MASSRAFPVAIAALLLAGVAATDVSAQCTTRDDASLVRKSINLATRCNNRILRSGTAVTCRQTAPPVCAGTLVGDAVALAYGPNNPPASALDRQTTRFQLTCQ
jgi:hypothetical protein